MSAGVAIDCRPFIAVELEAQITRPAGVPTLGPVPGLKASARWLAALARILGKAEQVRVVVRIEREKPRRSQQANAYLWGVAYPVLLDGLRQIAMDAGEECPIRSLEHLHEVGKATFLPAVKVAPGLVDRPTTTTLNSAEFAAYVNALIGYGAERGVWIPPATHEGSAA